MTQSDSGPTQQALREIDTLVRARYPILYLLTHEETRLESLLFHLARKQNKELFTWTATQGLNHFDNTPAARRPSGKFNDPAEVLQHIGESSVSALFLLKDFHPFLDDPHIVRRLRDLAHDLKGSYKNILISSPRLNLPVELDKEITLIDFPFPDTTELMELLKSVSRSVKATNRAVVELTNEQAAELVRAAQGLTLTEAENAFSKAVVSDGRLSQDDIELVLREKQQVIRKSGMLEFYATDAGMTDVGGLGNLKYWLSVRGKGFSAEAAHFGLPVPKGVLLLGAPGCGKSLTAKAVASAWRLPLVKLDFGHVFSGLVGSSEENMRRALKVAEGVAPCVLWIDEIEKGLSGNQSGGSDGGTAARVFGTFLTWMQEKTARVFVIATANRIDALPPELLRRGRFDEIFFMDLPDERARREILTIHLKKRSRIPEEFELDRIASALEGFSGAEIEHCVVEGMFAAFHHRQELKSDDILAAARETVPLSVTYKEELARSREWARNRARPADHPPENAGAKDRTSHLELS